MKGVRIVRLEMKVLTALNHQSMTAREMAKELNVLPRSITSALDYLEHVGLISRDDLGRWEPVN